LDERARDGQTARWRRGQYVDGQNGEVEMRTRGGQTVRWRGG